MSSVLPRTEPNLIARMHWSEWALLLLGFGFVYLPTYWDLTSGLWQTEENGHGPIILGVSAWLMWRKRAALQSEPDSGASVTGWMALVFGLFLYVVGRSQDILVFEVGSQVPVILGSLLIIRGWPGARVMWFPMVFLVFMIPIPGVLVDTLTGPLKQAVSQLAETVLYAAGYPIARSGVILSIGQYQLLVADACSGLNSMFSLSALGLLYLYLVPSGSWWRDTVLIVTILPVAFLANVTRTVILVLITFHFGDAAGQGFLHGFAGILLFAVALLIFFAITRALAAVARLTRQEPV